MDLTIVWHLEIVPNHFSWPVYFIQATAIIEANLESFKTLNVDLSLKSAGWASVGLSSHGLMRLATNDKPN